MTSNDANFFRQIHQQMTSRAAEVLLITDQQQRYTYGDADAESARLARFMTDLGVAPGDRVSVQVEKSPAALWLYLACLRAGFVFHPLNTAYQSSELEYFLGNAEPTLLVCDSARQDQLQPLADAAGVKHLLTLDADESGSLMEQSRASAANFSDVPRAADDLAALLYSSGTTGVPKGIMLTHQNLLVSAETLVQAWGFSSADRLLHALPVFHVHGLFVATHCALLSGASMRWLPGFNTDRAIDYLRECTVMMGVPTYYTRLLASERFTADACANVRLFVSGSAPLLQETFTAFAERSGHRILERYGMTETNMNTSNPLHGERKPGTVGPPLPGVEIRVADANDQPLAAGEIGNLQVKGRNVFKGYWKLPQKTAEDFTADGFFNTGDKGLIDDDGYVTIVGRAKDLVISGGLNVYPKEVELLIDDLPGVKESAVIGAPHADFGEAVVAVVVPLPGQTLAEDSIISAVKAQAASFKVPKRVVFVDELPRNTMGKVQKNVLRDTYKSILQS
ncbi:malonyl-CoA synthase [Pseudomaricurvus alcaniphilus]|uniref:malonate--CoA ligase n=1 Tax=Pseudomaricurvus alcaniphilus TaxID=1166482 RepID=UPI00140B24E3|nr:malonyl-CoA synthase [Pseudomaricurvus alcaniphilus]NHN38072.1 malonyl-CoA synthase [Pseudomaricurvus alcaniphilus]